MKEEVLLNTPKFGIIKINSVHFNDKDYFKRDDILNYKVNKINIWTGKKEDKDVIIGIQFFYKNIFTGKTVSPGSHIGTEQNIHLHEILLGTTEYLTEFKIRIDSEVTQIKFISNLNQKYEFGGEIGEEKINDLEDKKYVIICPFGCTTNYLDSCGFWYVDKLTIFQKHLIGYIELRILLRNRKEFKERIKNSKYDFPYNVLIRACSTPDIIFTTILKYCLF